MSGWLLDGNADVNARGGEYGSMLQAASARSHEAVVWLLLEWDVDVNAQGAEELCIWQCAVCGIGWVVTRQSSG